MRFLHRSSTAGFVLSLSTVLAIGGCDDDSVELPTNEYVVAFNLGPTTAPVGALQIEVEFLGSIGAWAGGGAGAVSCRWIVNAALHACNDKARGRLTCALVDQSGFTGPTELMECNFLSKDDALTADDFDVRVVDSSGIDLAPIDADVTITVDPSPPATTTTIDPDNPPPQYSVVFDLVEAERPAAALQFDITHPGLTGGWLGAGGDVDCRWLVTSNARACNDRGNGILSCAVVNSAGLGAPVSILECGFASYDPVRAGTWIAAGWSRRTLEPATTGAMELCLARSSIQWGWTRRCRFSSAASRATTRCWSPPTST